MNDFSRRLDDERRQTRPIPVSTATPAMARTLSSADLLANSREVMIEHSGALYRLRSTKNGKLILTK
jgi:hemin uptake protein HemP